MGTDIRGNRINTMLLDEPDAHLHPSMCKMMVEILKKKAEIPCLMLCSRPCLPDGSSRMMRTSRRMA